MLGSRVQWPLNEHCRSRCAYPFSTVDKYSRSQNVCLMASIVIKKLHFWNSQGYLVHFFAILSDAASVKGQLQRNCLPRKNRSFRLHVDRASGTQDFMLEMQMGVPQKTCKNRPPCKRNLIEKKNMPRLSLTGNYATPSALNGRDSPK